MEITIYAQDTDWAVKLPGQAFPRRYPSRQIALDAARTIGREMSLRLVMYERGKAVPVIFEPGTY